MDRSDVSVGLYYHKISTDASGLAIYTRELARALAEFTDVTVYTGVEGTRQTPIENVDVVGIPLRNGRRVDPIRQLASVLAHDDARSLTALLNGIGRGVFGHVDRNVDLLLDCYYLDDVVLSHLVDVPLIYQYHGLPTVGIGGWAREWLSATEYHLANSRTTASEVADQLDREVDAVVTPGVDTDRFHPAAEPAFDVADPVVTFVGRFVEGKGIFDLLPAFAGIAGDAHLCLVGSGEGKLSERSRLDRRLRDLGIEDDVTILGEIPHEEIHRYYAASDVVCYPTHYESFGLVNVEAMACGVPVVSTTVDGVTEYATHGENSLLVEPGDADALEACLRRLVESPALRDRLGAAGRTVAEEYSWEIRAESFLDFCTDVVLE